MNKNKLIVSLILNLLVFIFMLVGFLWMVFTTKDYEMCANGLLCLVYFTVLSNIFAGVSSLIYFIFQLLKYFKNVEIKRWSFILQFVSTISTSITFFVVVLLLAPLNAIYDHESYFSMFYGPNFFLHFVVPVIGIINFIFLQKDDSISYKCVFLCLIPVVLYGVFYFINYKIQWIKIVGPDHKLSSDWYHFLIYGEGYMLVLIPLGFILVTLGLGYLYLFLNKKVNNKKIEVK